MKKFLTLLACFFALAGVSGATDFTADSDILYGNTSAGTQAAQFYQTWGAHKAQLSLLYQGLNTNLTEYATTNPSANGLSLISAADYAAMKVLLDFTASEISVVDSGANYTATDVEGILAEIAPQLGGGAVDSVNTHTGVVVLDADDLSDAATTNKFATAGELAEIATNTTKDTNVSTTLSTGTVTATTYGITSDGGLDDVVLVEATMSVAGLLGADKWDEIAANTAKDSNETHSGDVVGATALTIQPDSVDIPMLSATGSATNATYLRGDNTWTTPSGSGDALVADPLSQFASTTSAQFAGVISNETGTGIVVLATSPSLVTPDLGVPTAVDITAATGTISVDIVLENAAPTVANQITYNATTDALRVYNGSSVDTYANDTDNATTYEVTVASGTSALGTSAITSGTCATTVTTSATGLATTDVINWGFNGDPTSVTGYAPTANGMLTIIAWPSTNNVNFDVCNLTAASITPGAITLNWRISR